MKVLLSNLWERFLDIFDRRVPASYFSKKYPEKLVISNAPLKNLKRGINRVANQLPHYKEDKK